MLQYQPSVICASAVYLALKTHGQTPWVRTHRAAPSALQRAGTLASLCLSCYRPPLPRRTRCGAGAAQTAELQRHSTYTEADLQVYTARTLRWGLPAPPGRGVKSDIRSRRGLLMSNRRTPSVVQCFITVPSPSRSLPRVAKCFTNASALRLLVTSAPAVRSGLSR